MSGTTEDPVSASHPGAMRRFVVWWRSLSSQVGIPVERQWQVALLVLLVIFLRRPSDFTYPQFAAEDGAYWYAQAYNNGWLHSLFQPNVGYLNTVPRLIAALALLVPLHFGPLVMNLCGALIQVLPVTALLSRRCSSWGPLHIRAYMAATYVLTPGTHAIHVTATNAPWHLAVLALLLAFAAVPENWPGYIADTLVFVLLGTSGPYSILIAPLAAVYAYRNRKRWHVISAVILSLTAVAQSYFVLFSPRGVKPVLGASVRSLLQIIGGNIFLGSVFGANPISHRLPNILLVISLALGGVILYYAFRAAPLPFLLFGLFAFGLLTASLMRPLAGDATPMWPLLASTSSCRYYYYTTLTLMWAFVWCAERGSNLSIRRLGTAAIYCSIIGISVNFWLRPYQRFSFDQPAMQFENAPAGTDIDIPIYPEGWDVHLHKH